MIYDVKYTDLRNVASMLLKNRNRLHLPKDAHSYRILLPEKNNFINIRISKNSLTALTNKKVGDKYYMTTDSFGVGGPENSVKNRLLQLVQQIADTYCPKNITKG